MYGRSTAAPQVRMIYTQSPFWFFSLSALCVLCG